MATPAATPRRPLLVGESNPYGGDPQFALYPAPDGCSGARLCSLILGMRVKDYLREFERCNLCDGPWDAKQARERAKELLIEGQKTRRPALILLGQKVARSFVGPTASPPFSIEHIHAGSTLNFETTVTTLFLPHPSGLCRLWNEPQAFAHARRLVAEVCPHLAHLLGAASSEIAYYTVDEEDE